MCDILDCFSSIVICHCGDIECDDCSCDDCQECCGMTCRQLGRALNACCLVWWYAPAADFDCDCCNCCYTDSRKKPTDDKPENQDENTASNPDRPLTENKNWGSNAEYSKVSNDDSLSTSDVKVITEAPTFKADKQPTASESGSPLIADHQLNN